MYSKISSSEPIRQGDIFRWLPKIEVVLGDNYLPIITEREKKEKKKLIGFS